MKASIQEKWKLRIITKLKKSKNKWIKKDVVIFGISEATQVVLELIKKYGGNVKCIIDNDPIQQNHTWMGLNVYSPENLKDFKNIIIIICGGLWYEKRQQLIKNKVPLKNIFIIKQKKVFFVQKLIDLILAWNILENLKHKYGNSLLLCPYPGTGDAFLTGRYLPNYLKENELRTPYTIIVVGKVFKKVLNMYGYQNIVTISQYECDKIKHLISCFGNEISGIYYMMYWGLIHQNTYHIENYKNISFNEIFEKCIFGHNVNEIFSPQFTNDKFQINELMNKYGIKKNHTVIIAPYANSFSNELPAKWWEKLVNELKRMGYKVFTNSSSDKEKIIAGTNKLYLSYQDMYPILEICGYLIGIRSGLFDLMSGSKCKKIVIYQDFITNERMNFFSLKNMGLSEDAIELKLDNSKKGREDLLESILKEFKNIEKE